MATYLITGAAGFIGSRVSELLLDDGHNVIGVDNLNDAYDVRIKQWRLARLEGRPNLSFHKLDICDRSALDRLHEDVFGRASGRTFDGVINLAARAGVRQSVENPWVYFETNTTGTLNLVELCRTHGTPKFVLASTSSLYGANNPQPFHENANTDGPLSPYAASKKAAEALCYTYHYLYGLDTTVLRFFTVYGPAGRPDMSLFRFVQWISEGRPLMVFGDGQQSRDFTYIDDIANGVVRALKPVGYQIINLGSDEPFVLGDAIRMIEELVGRQAEMVFHNRHPADVLATWADISRAREVLGWEPHVSFADGVAELVRWYQANRDWAKDVRTL